MISAAEAIRSLYGAYRLARLDSAGLNYLDRSQLGAIRSFWAGPVVMAGYVLLRLLRVEDLRALMPVAETFAVVEVLAFVISWIGYLVLMNLTVQAANREHRYLDFVTAYNWAMVVQIAVLLPVLLIVETGLIPEMLGDMVAVAATLTLLFYQWFVTRVALAVSAAVAAGMVGLDMLVGLLVSGMADAIIARAFGA